MMPSFPQHRLKRKASPGDSNTNEPVAPVPLQESTSGLFDAAFDRIVSLSLVLCFEMQVYCLVISLFFQFSWRAEECEPVEGGLDDFDVNMR